MEKIDYSDQELLVIWRKQAFEFGMSDYQKPTTKLPYGLNAREREKIRARAEIMGGGDPFDSYRSHRNSASRRGIDFLLTFQEWWTLWEPYWKQRGQHGHGLEMCRTGDKGPYKVGNVFIASGIENREMTKGKPGSGWLRKGARGLAIR